MSIVVLCIVLLVACVQTPESAHSKPHRSDSDYLQSLYFGYHTMAVTSVFVKNEIAYITTTDGIEIYDIRNPKTPRRLGSFASQAASDIKVVREFAFVCGGLMHEPKGYFKVFNISSPNNIKLMGETSLAHGSVGLEVAGNYAYVSGLDSGLFIIDISKKGSPKLVRTVKFPRLDNPHPLAKLSRFVDKARKKEQPKKFPFQMGRTWYTDIKGDYIYVNDENTGLHILDISNPKNPRKVGEIIHKFMKGTKNLAQDAFNDIVVKKDIGYITLDNGGMLIVDLKHKNRPAVLSHYNPWKNYEWQTSPGHMVKLVVRSDIAYVAAGKDGLHIIDVKNPKKPSLLEKIAIPENIGVSWGIYAGDGLIYVNYFAADPGGKRRGQVLKGGWEIFKIVDRRP
jgi:hypothetical protein